MDRPSPRQVPPRSGDRASLAEGATGPFAPGADHLPTVPSRTAPRSPAGAR